MTQILDVNIKYKVGNFRSHFNFSISDSITGIWGESGHGKTTLLHLISGLLKPDEGTIHIFKKPVCDTQNGFFCPAHKRNIGVVFQDARLFPHMSVEKNLLYGFDVANKNDISFKDVVSVLGIAHLLHKKPSECSGGEKQRIAIGRALLAQANLLLLDEPFSALDRSLKMKAILFIKKVIKAFDIPVVIISHDIADILQLTNNILLINKGKVEAKGTFIDLLMQGFFKGVDFNRSFVNNLKFTVISKTEASHYSVKLKDSNLIYSLFSPERALVAGEEIHAFLRPGDIAISSHFVEGISIQNQIRTEVLDIYFDSNSAFSLLNVGTGIIAQTTLDSVSRLKLKKGDEIYALFKSAALVLYDDSMHLSLGV